MWSWIDESVKQLFLNNLKINPSKSKQQDDSHKQENNQFLMTGQQNRENSQLNNQVDHHKGNHVQ